MKIRSSILAIALALPFLSTIGEAQRGALTSAAASAPTVIPALVPFSGVAAAADGKPLTGESSITFLIFKDEQGGEPLWLETQTVPSDTAGHYKVQLGAANPNGLPGDLFATGEARWLEVQIAGEAAQPRVLLASVPYALKAADAATLGGLPASAFVLAGSNVAVANATSAAITPDAETTVTTTGGTANTVAKFSAANTIVNSILYDNGTEVGIGTTSPSATLTVAGSMTVNGEAAYNGPAVFGPTGTATAKEGYDSQLLKIYTSAYNSSSKAVVEPRFEWQAEVTNNDTSAPAATLNLLASTTSANAGETGFYLNTNGIIHFTSGQTFPGTSSAGIAVDGTSTSGTGVEGVSSTGSGVLGTTAGSTLNEAGVLGKAGAVSGITNVAAGVWGDSSTQVGVEGTSKSSVGVYGQSTNSYGVNGRSTNSYGVFGQTDASSGVYAGVYGYSSNNLPGVKGEGTYSSGGEFIGGTNSTANATGGDGATIYGGGGFYGGNGMTVYGGQGSYSGTGIVAYGANNTDDAGDGISANGGNGPNFYTTGSGIYATGGTYSGGAGYAAYLDGDVKVTGTLTAEVKDFKIDDPTDPANKYLAHTSVESSEMMDIYTGNVTTDELGLATVTLPSWFQTLNTDFRYQLTVIGGRFAQAIVSKEIDKNQFTISTNATAVKVSWQVTAVRQDAYAMSHPLVVQQTKPANELGFYMHPELYGQPKEKQIEWGRRPEHMRRLQADREEQQKRATTAASNIH
jgi:trimeric autotransporter adhesin